jgi:large subunit ribosomal protein L4
MAALKAPVLGGAKKEVSLEESVFGVEIKPHLVHEAVRSELNEHRQGTRAAKSRGLVSGGRAKPWRQKGTGRARAGTTRAPHWTGGGVAFPPTPRDFEVKVNRKTRRAAMRGALTVHVQEGTLAVLDSTGFDAPSTKLAVSLIEAHGMELPLVVVTKDEQNVVKSFRNIEKVVVTTPGELEVAALVWARSVLVTEDALDLVKDKAS